MTSFIVAPDSQIVDTELSKPRLKDPEDSPSAKAMRLFKLKNPKDYKPRGLGDRLDYPPFVVDDKIKEKKKDRDQGIMVPKGNPYQMTRNSEVMLNKEKLVREKEEQERILKNLERS